MIALTRKAYPSDLTDDQWNLIEPLIPPKIGKGKNRKTTCERSSTAPCTCCEPVASGITHPTTCFPKERPITTTSSILNLRIQFF